MRYAIQHPQCRPPSPPSVSRNQATRPSSIHSGECPIHRYFFFTRVRSRFRSLRNSVASASRSVAIPIINSATRLYRWLYVRRINRHRALGTFERTLAQSRNRSRLIEPQTRLAEIESAVSSLKVARPFEVDLQRLRIHLQLKFQMFLASLWSRLQAQILANRPQGRADARQVPSQTPSPDDRS